MYLNLQCMQQDRRIGKPTWQTVLPPDECFRRKSGTFLSSRFQVHGLSCSGRESWHYYQEKKHLKQNKKQETKRNKKH